VNKIYCYETLAEWQTKSSGTILNSGALAKLARRVEDRESGIMVMQGDLTGRFR